MNNQQVRKHTRASLVAQLVKNLPAVQETQVQSLCQEDPLGKEMATHPSILAWEIPLTEEPGGLQSMVSQKSQMQLSTLTSKYKLQQLQIQVLKVKVTRSCLTF